MGITKDELEKWWAGLHHEQRTELKEAAQHHGRHLPSWLTGTQHVGETWWDGDPEAGGVAPSEELRMFITEQGA
jgi:hypothetical protein